MGLTGSGSGGNVGGPQVPLQRDLEVTAWTEINKANLGITSDSLEKAFTQINPRYTSGYYGGYKSSEGQPLLDHPLESGRIAQGFDALQDESWKAAYYNFIKQLPEDLQELFNTEGRKPFDDRKGRFVAFDNLLMFAAILTTRATVLAQMEAAGSLDTERALLNQILPFTALRGAMEQGSTVTEAALNHVQSLGANHPLFDTFTHVLKQMGAGVNELQQLAKELKQSGISQPIIGKMSDLATALHTANEALKLTNLGGNLQILNSTMFAMTTSATSLSLSSSGSGSLFLGLSLSSIGMKTGESETGFIGDSLTKIVNSLSSGLFSSLIPNAAIGNQRLLEMCLTTGFASLIGASSLAIDPGYGVYPNKDPTYAKSSQFFGFELMLLLMNSSGALKQTLIPFLQASGAHDKPAVAASEILSQIGNLLMIAAGTRDGRQNPAHLVESTSGYLERGVTAASDTVNGKSNEAPADEMSNALSIALQQSQIALDEKDYEGFLEAYANLLETLGTTLDRLTSDIDVISKQTRTIFQSASDHDTESSTTVVHFV